MHSFTLFCLVKDKVKEIIPKDFGSKTFEKNIIFRNIFDKKFVLLDCFSLFANRF
ncbi:hypothetical protein BSM4216_3355 [Bacillus smithii]|nr:hypothetical protein BSM4216_3355 [Bacillus smithii]